MTSFSLLLPLHGAVFLVKIFHKTQTELFFVFEIYLKFLFKGTRNNLGNMIFPGNVIHMNDQIKFIRADFFPEKNPFEEFMMFIVVKNGWLFLFLPGLFPIV